MFRENALLTHCHLLPHAVYWANYEEFCRALCNQLACKKLVKLLFINLHQMGIHLQLVHILAKYRLMLSLGADNFIHMNRLGKYLRELREQRDSNKRK